uniref:Spry-domain-containing protein n=1 Tax=Tetraselmis sp. GSL018 TaxID=582737 RepID=A0A061S2Q0_9CHLO|mmetsp:Transcript_39311/g.93110  ORF Transcript_39311/g.93110 Transcript_39311/m.93110 type:complete len:296 (-) Transcript_39311:55-942(-)
MIGLHSHGEEVEVNFGQKPFQFDVEEIRTEDRAQRDAEISKVKVEPGVCHSLVRDFLIHFGYGRTLSVFDSLAGQSQDSSACRPKPQPGCDTGEATSGSEQPMAIDFEGDAAESDERCSSMAARMSIRGLILSGEIEAAVDLLRKNHPKFFGPAHQDMLFLLYCQSFIEKIRQRQLDKAMNFAHLYLSPMRGRCEMQDSILSEVFALIAYADPEQSPLSYLMTMQHREIVADAINAAMICDLPERREPSDTMPRPVIELLLKQLAAVHLAIRDSNGQGEALDLRELVMRPPGSQD